MFIYTSQWKKSLIGRLIKAIPAANLLKIRFSESSVLTFLLTGLSSLCRSNLIFKLKKKSFLLHGRIALLVKTILVTQGSHGHEKSLNF